MNKSKTPTSFRISEATHHELSWLAARGYSTMTAAMEAAVHRLYEKELGERAVVAEERKR